MYAKTVPPDAASNRPFAASRNATAPPSERPPSPFSHRQAIDWLARHARIAARRLGNAVLLTLNGYGHTSDKDPSACIDRAVRRYLVTTTPPPDATICQPDRQPFDPNFGQPLP